MAKDKKDAAKDKDAKDAPAEELSPEVAAKKKKKKLIMMAGIGGVAVLVIAGALMFMLSGGSKAAKTVKAGEEDSAATEEAAGEHGEKKEEHGEKKEGGEHGKKEEKKSEHGGKKEEKKSEHGEKKEGGEGHGEKKEGGEKSEGGEGHGEKKPKEGEAKAEKKASDSGLDDEAIREYGDAYALKPFHLNLGNALENRYIRLEVSFHYSGAADSKRELDAKSAQIRDVIGTIVGRKTREFLLARDGKMQLRKEIFDGVNEFLKTPIKDVFVTDMMIE